METTEKIVEAYCRYIKGWFTITNLKGPGQSELDILAIDTTNKNRYKRYHIEVSVSISGGFSKLNNKPFSTKLLKDRVKMPGMRRTLGFFKHRKFNKPEVKEMLNNYGFKNKNYEKVIVSWGWSEDVPKAAEKEGILLWDFRDIISEIGLTYKKDNTYFTDDTLRTLQLYSKAIEK